MGDDRQRGQPSNGCSRQESSMSGKDSLGDVFESFGGYPLRPLAVPKRALYHAASMPSPLHTFASIGRQGSMPCGVPPPTSQANPPSEVSMSAESAPLSPHLLPSFAPAFNSFGRSSVVSGDRSSSFDIPRAATAYPPSPFTHGAPDPTSPHTASAPLPSSNWGPYATAAEPRSVGGPAPPSSCGETGASMDRSRSSFGQNSCFGHEDMEISYRDWHNGVFSPSW